MNALVSPLRPRYSFLLCSPAAAAGPVAVQPLFLFFPSPSSSLSVFLGDPFRAHVLDLAASSLAAFLRSRSCRRVPPPSFFLFPVLFFSFSLRRRRARSHVVGLTVQPRRRRSFPLPSLFFFLFFLCLLLLFSVHAGLSTQRLRPRIQHRFQRRQLPRIQTALSGLAHYGISAARRPPACRQRRTDRSLTAAQQRPPQTINRCCIASRPPSVPSPVTFFSFLFTLHLSHTAYYLHSRGAAGTGSRGQRWAFAVMAGAQPREILGSQGATTQEPRRGPRGGKVAWPDE